MKKENVPHSKEEPLSALTGLRQRIDKIDDSILQLVNERAKTALQIGELKKKTDSEPQFYRPEREAQLLRTLKKKNTGPLDDTAVGALFREIMSVCLELEQPTRVGFPELDDMFPRQAALKHFGRTSISVPLQTTEDVFRGVADKTIPFGVIPVHNVPEGVVSESLEHFLEYPLFACGEVSVPVRYCLLSNEGTLPGGVMRICAPARAQVRSHRWLDAHYPGVERLVVSSQAEAIDRVRSEKATTAIVDKMAAEQCGLSCLASDVGSEGTCVARFLVIGRTRVPPSGQDRTSLLVSVPDNPGKLHALLTPFKEHCIDPVHIAELSVRSADGRCCFFVVCPGHCEDPAFEAVTSALAIQAADCTLLGSYPVEAC